MRLLCLLFGLGMSTPIWSNPFIFDTILPPSEPIFQESFFDQLYQEDEMVKVMIHLDLQTLLKNRKTNNSVPAKFYYPDENGELVKRKAKIKVRGKTRRKKCDFPPLQVKFKKKKLKKDSLAPFNQLKLVTHCFDDEVGEKNIFKEYLAYRLYNILTEKSFKVQLLSITYVDSTQVIEPFERYGFFIETTDDLKERLNVKTKQSFAFPPGDLDQENYLQLSAFQYMIGNTDWYLKFLHNIKLMTSNEDSMHNYLVPYDFDFSGLVNAHYAVPNPNLGQQKVVDRFFQGEHQNNEAMEAALERIKMKKEACKKYCESYKWLSKKDRKKVWKYLNSFFKTIENRQKKEEIFFRSTK